MLKISQKTTLILLANFFVATCVHAQTELPAANDTFTEVCEIIPAVIADDGSVTTNSYTKCTQKPVRSAAEELFYDTMGAATGTTNATAQMLEDIGTTATNTTEIAASVQGIKGEISGVTTETGQEGDETQQTLVTMIGRTNYLLEYYLSKTPDFIKMGLYGTKGLNLAKMRAIDQTLPDALAPLVKTQQNIAAVLDPLNPSGRDLTAQGPLDKKVRDSFAGINDLVMPGGLPASNRYEYTAKLLLKLLYPQVKGGKPVGADAPALPEALETKNESKGIYTAFLKPSDPEYNIEFNYGSSPSEESEESAKNLLTSSIEDEKFKKAANIFIMLKNLEHRYANCHEEYQKPLDDKGAGGGGGTNPEYFIANTKGKTTKCEKDDESCIKVTAACGPITQADSATGTQEIALAYANGFNQMIIDTDKLVDETDLLGTSLDTSKKVLESKSNAGSGVFTCSEESGDLVKVCESVNVTLARFVKNFKENLSIANTKSKLAEIRGNPKGEFKTGSKKALSDVKPLIEGAHKSMSDPLKSLYSYLFLKLDNSILKSSGVDITPTAASSDEDKSAAEGAARTGGLPSFATYMDNATYANATKSKSSSGSTTGSTSTGSSVTVSSNEDLLECVDTGPVNSTPTQITSGASAAAMSFVNNLSGLADGQALTLEGLPIPKDWELDSKKYQVILTAGAWVPLSLATGEGNQYEYKIKAESKDLFIIGKDSGTTTKTASERPGFYQELQTNNSTKVTSAMSAMLGRTTAYSSLMGPYEQRNTKYSFTCRSLTNTNSTAKSRTVHMTPIQAMKSGSSWRLNNKSWRKNVTTMDTNNLLREMLFLLAEMRQMQFEQYITLQKTLVLQSTRVAQGAAMSSAAGAFGGGSDPTASYLTGRKQESGGGAGAGAAASATDAAEGAASSMPAGPSEETTEPS